MTQNTSVPFRPKLQGIFRERFYDKIKYFKNSMDKKQVDKLVEQELNWVVNNCKINIKQREVYRTTWLLLRDLLRTGWIYRINNGILELALPNKKDIIASNKEMANIKEKMRDCMELSRIEKLMESQEFILRMESNNNDEKSIINLIANGDELYNDLIDAVNLDNDIQKLKLLSEKIKPYLQLVSENERDSQTGLRLIDIWRYFRLTWSNPAESTPGRTMMYLIRDAGRKYHPIMGIASLENSALQITCRDDFFGWTTKSFTNKFKNQSLLGKDRMLKELLRFIDIGVSEINLEGLCTFEECQNPNNELIEKLKNKEAEATRLREMALKNDNEVERSKLGSRISKNAEQALYLRKRSSQLYALLIARKKIMEVLSGGTEDHYDSFVESEEGQSVTRTALLSVKKRHIGSSIMELNVCGAIPPYNNILGGKLVALMMLSGEVIENYREKYNNSPSQIASLIKGEDVTRPAELIYIGTTSLYYVGSSQYNRIKLPKGLFGKSSPEVILKRLGTTTGYGSMHISDVTTKCLTKISNSKRGYHHINNVFGEGASPKLRLISMGITDVMEEGGQNHAANEFSKHSMSRIVYGAQLISNLDEYIYGYDTKPNYYFNGIETDEVTRRIIDYWRKRWLLMRINHTPALEAIKNFNKKNLLVSSYLQEGTGTMKYVELKEERAMTNLADDNNQKDKLNYVRRLYKGFSSYSDYIDMDALKFIHVKTDLDLAIISAVQNGKSVILTGNPGDGKTHIFRVLEEKIRECRPDVVIELDASILKDEEIIKRWKDASEKGKPYCIAINEAVLFNLADLYPNFKPLAESKLQLINSIYYDEEPPLASDHSLVLDLSIRNNLDKDITTNIINKQTDSLVSDCCKDCVAKEHCDFRLNAKLLQNNIFKERLQYIFDRLDRRGYHFTLREIQGYISFLLFAGRSCQHLSRASSMEEFYLQNLIYGSSVEKSRFFERMMDTFDPVNISHPIIDEKLINGDYPKDSWIANYNSESSMVDPDDFTKYRSRKRAFFFFNNDGDQLIDIADDDESQFARFIEKKPREALRHVIKQLNLFFGYDDSIDTLYAWQSHRFDISPRRILYSHVQYSRSDFEIVHPKLHSLMGQAFSPKIDHVLFRLKDNHSVALKIDYNMFEVLSKAERGVPMMFVESSVTRRVWQFMERLDKLTGGDEVLVSIYDTQSGEKCNIEIDKVAKQYIGLEEG